MNKKQKRAKASQNNAFALLLYILYKIYALFIISASNQISSCINSQEDKEKYREAP